MVHLRARLYWVAGLCLLATAQQSSAAQIARWSMNEGAGSVAASAFGAPAANATLFGTPQWTSNLLAPVAGNTSALYFGDGESFLLSNAFAVPTADAARTISAWVRTTSNQNLTIFDYGLDTPNSRFTLRTNSDANQGSLGAIRLEVAGGFAVANTPINDGQWHHVALSLPAAGSVDDARLYVDGVLDGDLATAPFSGLLDANINTADALVRIGERVNGQFNFSGLIDEVQFWDEQLSDAAIAALVPAGPLPVFEFVVDRDSGNISLQNNFGTTVDEIVGYSLSSPSGTFDVSQWQSVADNYDADSGTPTFDNNDTWFELTNTASPTGFDLSEFAPGGNGGALANGGSLDLGNVWIAYPVEDIAAEVIFAGGDRLPVGVRYVGTELVAGDLNRNGAVDPGDWTLFSENLFATFPELSAPQTYFLGDLDGDGDVDRFDFVAFEQLYDDARGLGALQSLMSGGAAVPEPASGFIAALAVALVWFLLRQFKVAPIPVVIPLSQPQKTAPMRNSHRIFTLGALLLCVATATSSQADVVAYYDFESPNPFNDRAGVADGTVTGTTSVTIAPGIIGDALQIIAGNPTLGTVDDWVTVPQASAPNFGTGDLSVSLWFRRANPQGDLGTTGGDGGPDFIYDSLSGTLSGIQLTILNNGTVNGRFDTNDAGFVVINSPAGAVEDNMADPSTFDWNHIVYSLDRNSATPSFALYVNGVSVGTQAAGDFATISGGVGNVSPSQDFSIGAGNNQPADGLIDDLAFFDQALTEQQILALYNRTASPLDFFERLKLEVNLSNGRVTLSNNTDNPIDFDYYEIASASMSLDSSAWQSLELQDNSAGGFPAGSPNGDGWQEGGSSNDSLLGETFLDGFSTFGETTQPISLGNIFRWQSGQQDLAFVYRDASTGQFLQGIVEYVTGGQLTGDFNGDGIVDAADYTVWRDTLGSSGPGLAADANADEVVDALDYGLWRANFGQTAAGALAGAANVPEPSTIVLLACGAAAVALRRRGLLVALCAVLIPVAATAAVTTDRLFTFGDDPFENGTAPNPVGQLSFGDTYDSWGDPFTGEDIPAVSGEFTDLSAFGPVYTNSVAPQAAPGNPAANTVAADFNGTSDYLRGFRLGNPATSAASTGFVSGTPGPIDYSGIQNRGFQLWVNPDVVGGNTQTIVRDTSQHGLAISSAGTWVMRYSGDTFDSGVPAVANAWTHAMVVVAGQTSAGQVGSQRSLLYIDGVVVAASSDSYALTDDTDLVVGATIAAGDTLAEFFDGTLDELEMFVFGTSLAERNQYGSFDPREDNDFIAAQTSVFGDLTGDGSVTMADVNQFSLGWLSQNRVNGVLAGDLTSYADGDLNFDGVTDLGDAVIFNSIMISAGLGGLNFSSLGTAVPEPSTMLLAIGAALFCVRLRGVITR